MRTLMILLLAGAAVSAQPPLRELAERRGIRIGTAADPALLAGGEQQYAATLAREFNQVEPENAGKFGPIHPARDRYNFAPLDALVAFAEGHHMAVRGHTLVWHNQNPAWLTGGHFTPAGVSKILHEHIQTVVSRYAGRVYAWDVVNEAFHADGTPRKTIWADEPGYIERAFRWAHAADPRALLFYNDFGAEAINAKSDAIYAMARDFKSRGVPISGIGLQMHVTTKPPALDSIEANLKRITDLGLQVQITELDVRLRLENGAAGAEQLAAQARTYRELVAACLKFRLCTAVQTWGFTDRHSWIPHFNRGWGAALEFDADYLPKPAYRGIAEALSR